MGLQESLEGLEPRERMLLGVFGALIVVFLIFLVPYAASSLLVEKTEQNALLGEALERLDSEANLIREAQERDEALVARYAKPAPALAGFLDKAASASSLEIPEIKDRSPVAHGKKYEERSTSISFRKAGLVPLVKFMEQVAGSQYPISISNLNIRKRASQPDSYDVKMVVSAFHRVELKKKEARAE